MSFISPSLWKASVNVNVCYVNLLVIPASVSNTQTWEWDFLKMPHLLSFKMFLTWKIPQTSPISWTSLRGASVSSPTLPALICSSQSHIAGVVSFYNSVIIHSKVTKLSNILCSLFRHSKPILFMVNADLMFHSHGATLSLILWTLTLAHMFPWWLWTVM